MSAIKRLYSILQQSKALGASDVHLGVGLAPAARVGGEIVLMEGDPLTEEEIREMVFSVLPYPSRKKIEEGQQVSVGVQLPQFGFTRISTYFHRGRLEASFRLVGDRIPLPEELGLPPVVVEMAQLRQGLVLIAGPTGAGKTTTFNAILNLINRSRRCRIVTVEDPVEYVHGPIRSLVIQQEIGVDTPSFAEALRHILRLDPDIIGIGEIRDQDTMQTALTAAQTGHLVVGTLHTPSAVNAIERIISLFPAEYRQIVCNQIASALSGIIFQLLLPRADQKGRVLAVEILRANNAIRNLIREDRLHQIPNFLFTARKEGMVPLDDSLEELYHQGLITYDTVMSYCRETKRFAKGGEVFR
jgi:twitching motility protein PilT